MICALADIEAYDRGGASTKTLRYTDGAGFVTKPADTPAHAYYAARLVQPATIRRDLFDVGTTAGASRVSFGAAILENRNGDLDALFGYNFDARAYRVYRGDDRGAYSAFAPVLVCTMEQALVSSDVVTLNLRGRQYLLDVPLQPTKYGGTNVLPDGVDGVAGDLKGKPLPVCYGSVFNVPAICVNTAKLIYQVNDGAIETIDAVRDLGIELMSGRAWRVSVTGFGNTPFTAVAYGAGTYVAVNASGIVWISSDARTWTQSTSPTSIDICTGIVYGAGLFVLVGHSSTAGAGIWTSPDGVTWTTRTTHITAPEYPYGISYVNSVFLATCTGGQLVTSPDAITWTARTTGASSGTPLQSAAFGAGSYVVVGWGGFTASSPDLVTWTSHTSGFGVWQIYGIVFDGTKFIMVGAPNVSIGVDYTVAVSSNGTAWTMIATGVTSTMRCVLYVNGYVIAAGDNGDMMITSDHGSTWKKQPNAFQDSSPWPEVVHALSPGANSKIIAVGGLTMPRIAISNQPFKTYTSLLQLEDDSLAPEAGQVGIYLAGGMFRLGSSPAGLITADVVEGATAADRTAAQIFKRILTDRAGLSGTDYRAADITALDGAISAEIGFWTNEDSTIADVINAIANSVTAWWGDDALGVFRIERRAAPSAGTPVKTFTQNDMKAPLARITSTTTGAYRGIPFYRTTVRYRRNYSVQTNDLAGGVTADKRGEYSVEWRDAKSEDLSVQTAHPLAQEQIIESLLVNEADAISEAAYRMSLDGVDRDILQFTADLNDENIAVDLHDVVTLKNNRFGLLAGRDFRVLSLNMDMKANSIQIGVWG